MADGPRPADADLLLRIERHAFDVPGASQPFEDRLARENGWTIGFARRAILEYRRFAFLFAASGRPVAPSDVVDQVWHLHLLYTRNYWDGFCRDVLSKPLHHEPAAGVADEREKLADWYADTLGRYREAFGPPPDDIWPDPQALARTPKPRQQKVDVGKVFVLPRRTVYLAGAAFIVLLCVLIVLLTTGTASN